MFAPSCVHPHILCRLQQLELELTEPAADLLKLLDQEIHSEVQGAFREVGNFRLRQLKRVLARMPLQPLVKLFPSQSPLGVEAQLDLLRLEMCRIQAVKKGAVLQL
mmetsp:Transcript_60853/g.142491  ORF Transcript_60853/g.142491 Transcript_60853/m.142491 type:complete len:106 (+) Transcript_60853:198-515(+)